MRICPQCQTRFSEPVSFCPHDGTPTVEVEVEPTVDPLLGRVIDGRYRVERVLGEGGMGVVYLITHAILGKRMALKVLRGEMARDPDVVQRFIQEAQSATQIGHSNIIDISDFGKLADQSVYFVMEYLDGQSLTQLIARGGAIPTALALHILRQIASALEAAHERGIVHRDLKPDNIYIVKQGSDESFVKVLDFGIAKVGGASSKLTKTGMIFGTPHYMSPEQAAGQSVDRRTDIYALGVIMYEMFAGRVPFDGDTFMGILSKHMFEAPVPPSQVKGAALGAIEDVVLKALQKKMENRYQSMGELIADLDRVQSGGTVSIGRAGRIAPPGNLADVLEPPSRTEMRLGGAMTTASASAQPEPTRRGPWIGLALVALLVLGSGAAWAAHRFAPTVVAVPTPPSATPPVTPTTTPTITPTTTPTTTTPVATPSTPATPTVTTSVPSTPSTTPTAAVSAVEIVSDPPGADVLLDGALIGQTPTRVPRPSNGERTITLRLRGYQDQRVMVLPTSSDTLPITLARAAGGGAHARPTTPTATPTPTPTPVAAPEPPAMTSMRTTAQSDVVDPWE